MDWTQFFTLMVTIIGSVGACYKFMHDDMNKMDYRIDRMENNWKEELKELQKEMKEDRETLRAEMRADRQAMHQDIRDVNQKIDRLISMFVRIPNAPIGHSKKKA